MNIERHLQFNTIWVPLCCAKGQPISIDSEDSGNVFKGTKRHNKIYIFGAIYF